MTEYDYNTEDIPTPTAASDEHFFEQYTRWVEKPSDLWIIFKEIRQQRSNL